MPVGIAANVGVNAAPPDDLDRALNESNIYAQDASDFLRDLPAPDINNANQTTNHTSDPDAEVKVRKQRKPVAKLDESRLLSDAGIPKLRSLTRRKLKFRGKGHEFSDMTRVLNMYQLWLDDLYPKAKFRDGLAMVEKLGHSRRVQVMRRGWIDGTKPNRVEEGEEVERVGDAEMSGALEAENGEGDGIFGEVDGEQGGRDAVPEEDDLDALMAEEPLAVGNGQGTAKARPSGPFEEDGPDEDELDALMREDAPTASVKATAQRQKPKGPFEEDDDDGPNEDELDALMAEGDDGPTNKAPALPNAGVAAPVEKQQQAYDFADDEEALADMGW